MMCEDEPLWCCSLEYTLNDGLGMLMENPVLVFTDYALSDIADRDDHYQI